MRSMTRWRGAVLAVAPILSSVPAAPAEAQVRCATETVLEGVRAYRELRLDDAARLLRSALEGRAESTACPDHAEALAYLGAAELYRGRAEVADEVFRRLALHDPRYVPDSVAFAPRVTDAFRRARRDTRAVDVVVPAATDLRSALDSLRIEVFSTSSQPVLVAVERIGSGERRTLYLGPGRDSMVVTWDGSMAGGVRAAEGRYLLTAAPVDTAGAAVRAAERHLLLEYVEEARVSAPLGPVQTTGWTSAMSIGGALLGGALVVALPSVVGGGDGASWRFTVAGAMAASGLAGVMLGRARRPPPAPRHLRIVLDSARTRAGGGGSGFW